MADLHVKNTGSATSPFDTWAKAAVSISTVTGAVAGDRYLLSSSHAGSQATWSVTLPGTATSPNLILGGTEGSTSGLTAMATGAKETITGTSFTLNGSAYIEKVQFEFSSASSLSPIFGNSDGSQLEFKDCAFRHTGAGSSSTFWFGSSGSGATAKIKHVNSAFKFGAGGQYISIYRDVVFQNMTFEAGGSNPTGIFWLNDRPTKLTVNGADFSNIGTSFNIIRNIADGPAIVKMRGIKFASGWAGSFGGSFIKPGSRLEMFDYMIGTTLYKAWIEANEGTIKSETTVKLSTDYSYKVVTNTKTKYPQTGLLLPELYVNLTGGASKTVTLNLLTDNVTLNNDDVILEAEFFGTSGSYLPSFGNSGPSDVLATNSALTTNSASWTTTGLTTPVKQEVSITFTPNQDGFAVIRPRVCKPSATVYVDNKVTVA